MITIVRRCDLAWVPLTEPTEWMGLPMNAPTRDNPQSEEQPWTIKRLLDWTTEHFEKRDPDNPRLRAEVLLAEALECQRIELYTQFDIVPES